MSYTAFIAKDLRDKIVAGTVPKLALRALAQEYNTSVRPVGQAIEMLIEEGFLKRKENGRIDIVEKLRKAKLHKKQEDYLNPNEQRLAIERALIEISMRGQDEFLREEQYAETFQIGRTALRSIFSEIAQTGIITHVPRKGWKLRGFTEKELKDFLTVREQMELLALDLAKAKLDKKQLQRYLHINQSASEFDGHEENALHEYIIQQADNRYVSLFFEQHAPFFGLLFKWESQNEDMRQEAREQHCAILEALIAGHWNKAKEALSHHIWNNHELLIQYVRQAAAS